MACGSQSAVKSIMFTGNVTNDFGTNAGVYSTDDGPVDVGMPPAFAAGSVSGWDVKVREPRLFVDGVLNFVRAQSVRFSYDYEDDVLHVGIECWTICTDADGDGVANRTGSVLTGLNGKDAVRAHRDLLCLTNLS